MYVEKELLENLLDKILYDISNITNIEQRDLKYSSLSKLYLPNDIIFKNIILSLYTDNIDLNEAYSKVFEYLSTFGEQNYHIDIHNILATIYSYISTRICKNDNNQELYEKLQKKMEIINENEEEFDFVCFVETATILNFIQKYWECICTSKESFISLSLLCQCDNSWEIDSQRRILFINQLIDISNQLIKMGAIK